MSDEMGTTVVPVSQMAAEASRGLGLNGFLHPLSDWGFELGASEEIRTWLLSGTPCLAS